MVPNLLKIMSLFPPPHPKYILFIKLTDFFQFYYNFCCVHFKQDVWRSVGDNFHFLVHLRVSYSSCNLSYYVGGPPNLLLWSQVSIIRNIVQKTRNCYKLKFNFHVLYDRVITSVWIFKPLSKNQCSCVKKKIIIKPTY